MTGLTACISDFSLCSFVADSANLINMYTSHCSHPAPCAVIIINNITSL